MTKADARTDQKAHVIERTDTTQPQWLSEKIGRDFGAGKYGGWAAALDGATRYTVDEAEAILVGPLAHLAPFCKIEEIAA